MQFFFLFLNFPFVCQNISVCLKLNRPQLAVVCVILPHEQQKLESSNFVASNRILWVIIPYIVNLCVTYNIAMTILSLNSVDLNVSNNVKYAIFASNLFAMAKLTNDL